MECPISAETMAPAFTATVLGKYEVAYYHCPGCGLLKTEAPHWLEEAYSEAVVDADTGILARNNSNAEVAEAIFETLGLARGRFLDVAGGYGLLTRLLRDKGFDCYSTDKYCQNIFAKRFEPPPDLKASALLAFEVLEHVENPLAFLTDAFAQYGSRTLVFSTLTFRGRVPPKKWWYYLFRTGQHISFYEPRTLAALAAQLGCSHYMLSTDMHLFTDQRLTLLQRCLVLKPGLRSLYSRYLRFKRRGLSKTWSDHQAA